MLVGNTGFGDLLHYSCGHWLVGYSSFCSQSTNVHA